MNLNEKDSSAIVNRSFLFSQLDPCSAEDAFVVVIFFPVVLQVF